MTIRFNCPNCNELIAFAGKHSGKRAHCANCGQKFIIPSDGKEKLKQIKPPKAIAEPLPGFYRALFIENKRLFTNPENITGMVFIAVLVCLKFFIANRNFTITLTGEAMSIDLPIPTGHVLHVAIWGFLFWYYMEIIYSIAFEHEKLPDVILGGFLGFYSFIWKIIKSVYTFFIILLLTELPCLVAAFISSWMDLEWTVLLYVLFFAGLFVFPIAILTAAVGRDLTMLRPDYFLIPIFRAFRPYIVTTVPFCAAVVLQIYAKQYSGQLSANAFAWYLLLNLAVQVIFLIAMCSIGLFFRHYSCLLPW